MTTKLIPSLRRKARKQKWLPILLEFISNLRIQSKETESIDDDRGGSELDLWLSQQIFIEALCDGLEDGVHEFYYLKSRQLGCTTVGLAIVLFWLAVHPRIIGCLVADDEKNSAGFRVLLKQIMKSFPSDFTGDSFEIDSDNKFFMSFSNGSRLDFLVAGKHKTSWADSKGYVFAWVSEIGNYGMQEGIDSFKEALSQGHPDRLFIYESRAYGYGTPWHDMWLSAQDDPYTKKTCFIGWWAKPLNAIDREDKRFDLFGTLPPNGEENELIRKVAEMYGHAITMEQLAWYRWRQSDRSMAEGSLEQQQPWTEVDAFQVQGYSFFANRVLQKWADEIDARQRLALQDPDDPDAIKFRGYAFVLGTSIFQTEMREITDAALIEQVTLRVWHEPHPDGLYVIGCDPAYGRTEWADRSAISVWRAYCDRLVQCAEFADADLETHQAAWVLAYLAGAYRNCLSDDSEILTRVGWKTYDQIKEGEEVVGFDTETGMYYWEAVRRVIIHNYSGEMRQFQSDGMDCLVTPNHRVVHRRESPKHGDAWRVVSADEITRGAAKHTMYAPKGGCPLGSGIPDLSVDMCRALGWIITDGHRRKYEITLVQAEATNKGGLNIATEIDTVLAKLCKHSRYDHVGSERRGPWVSWVLRGDAKKAFDHWLEVGDIHAIPRKILEGASEEQAAALFQGLLEGDGGWDTRSQAYTVFCPGHSQKLADNFQELALRLGYSATIIQQRNKSTAGSLGDPQYVVRLARRSAHSFVGRQVTTENYAGKVWCVSVPSGAFVMRRNGKVAVTGNCIVNVELAGPGRAIMREFDQLRERLQAEIYANRVRALEWDDFLDQARWYLYHRPDSPGPGFAYNFESSWRTKMELLNQFRDSFTTQILDIRSLPLLGEMGQMRQTRSDIAPEAPGKQKDDRVFAAALANRAWLDHLRSRLMQEGATYETISKTESGEYNVMGNFMRRLVYNFWRTAEERAENPYTPTGWLQDRGFE